MKQGRWHRIEITHALTAVWLAQGLEGSTIFICIPVYGPSRASFGKINNSHLHPSLKPISHQVWEDHQLSFTSQFTVHLAPALGRSTILIYIPVYGPSRTRFGKITNSHLHASLRPILRQVWEDHDGAPCQVSKVL